jgi:hypothetical protein
VRRDGHRIGDSRAELDPKITIGRTQRVARPFIA